MQLEFQRIRISHIILMSLVLHAFVISQPQFLQVWDESIFLEITRDFLEGEDHTPHQLPGIKFFVGAGITIFGDNWFSWRVPSVIFGMLTLLVFFKVVSRVTSENKALLATTILSFDTIFFVHSSLFLRDVPLMFFGLFSLYLYQRKSYYLTAIVLGFSLLIKETGIFFLVLIAIYHLWTRRPSFSHISIKNTILFLVIIGASFLLPLWIYDVIYTPIIYDPVIPTDVLPDGREVPISYPTVVLIESRGYDLQKPIGNVTNPIEHLGVFFSDGYLSSQAYKVKNWETTHTNFPWSWILPLPPPEDANGLGWVAAKKFDDTQEGKPNRGKILGIEWRGDPNVPLWFFGFWGTLFVIGYGFFRKEKTLTVFLLAGIVSMYVPYLILSITGRVMFPYYFILTVPFISLGSILALSYIKNSLVRKISYLVFLAIIVSWFILHYPVKIL